MSDTPASKPSKPQRQLAESTRYRRIGSWHAGTEKRLHRWRAEKALGKPLPPKVEVHHWDGSRRDDAPLVICQDHEYHMLLHYRAKVIAAGGNPDTDALCQDCGPKNKSEFHEKHRYRKDGSCYRRTRYVCRNCYNQKRKAA